MTDTTGVLIPGTQVLKNVDTGVPKDYVTNSEGDDTSSIVAGNYKRSHSCELALISLCAVQSRSR